MKKRRARDFDKLSQLYEQFAHRLYRYLSAFLADPASAEDVLQNVFLKLARHRGRLRRLRDPESYLFRSARNEAISLLRRARRDRADAGRNLDSLEASEEKVSDSLEELRDALARLPHKQREVVILKIYGELSFTEIGKLVGIPRDTAASRYRLALEKLKRFLKAGEDET